MNSEPSTCSNLTSSLGNISESSLKLSPSKIQANLVSQSNLFKLFSSQNYDLFDTFQTTRSFSDTKECASDSISNNTACSSQTNAWKSLLEPDFTIKNLISLVYAIIQMKKTDFMNEFQARLKKNSKADKDKVLSLRNELFKHLYLILGYPPTKSLCLPEKTAYEMLEDIHVLCECYASRTLKIDVLDLFAGGILGIQDEFNRTLLDCIKQSNKNMNELREKVFVAVQENTQLKERLNIVEALVCNLATLKFGSQATSSSLNQNEETYASVTKSNLDKIKDLRHVCSCGNKNKPQNDNSDSDGFVATYEKKKATSGFKKPIVKPYSYYIGQWDLDTKPEAIFKWVSRFAKVIELVELATHIPNRLYRSFKVVVESTYDAAMWDKKNWPKGVIIERFFEKKPHDTRLFNLPVTNHRAIEISSDSDESKSVAQESIISEEARDEELRVPPGFTFADMIKNMNKKEEKKLKLMQFNSADPVSENKPIYVEDENENEGKNEDDNEDENEDDREASLEEVNDNAENTIYYSEESLIDTVCSPNSSLTHDAEKSMDIQSFSTRSSMVRKVIDKYEMCFLLSIGSAIKKMLF